MKPEGAVLLHGHSHGNLDEFNRNSLELKTDIGVEGELFQSIKRIPTLQDVYEFFMAKAEAFGVPTLALYARYRYWFRLITATLGNRMNELITLLGEGHEKDG